MLLFKNLQKKEHEDPNRFRRIVSQKRNEFYYKNANLKRNRAPYQNILRKNIQTKMVNGTGKGSKKGNATKPAPANASKPKKDKKGPGRRTGIPNYYLKQKVLKQIYNHFHTYDNTIHTISGEVEITTEKIGKAIGLNHTGTTYDDKITPRELSEEDYNVYKLF
ncbi:hypothetical protein PIB30_042008 [Stylosanthes scabra]|uniref:Uncharacterized protein n=1 Tax=Stylosanthes scabra TaxID=79078 RepID=A0ABU6RF74_9FABA|nr:hypothetical protein [Stylosanthes scabra]